MYTTIIELDAAWKLMRHDGEARIERVLPKSRYTKDDAVRLTNAVLVSD